MAESTVQIWRGTSADAPALSALSAALFPLGCPAGTRPEDLAEYIRTELTPQRFAALLGDDRSVALLAKKDGALAGYALFAPAAGPAPVPAAVRGELRKFYVDPAHHGRGVADALMRELLAVAASLGHQALWLSVFSENHRARAFYSRWGFRLVGTQDFLVGSDPQRDCLMVRGGCCPESTT